MSRISEQALDCFNSAIKQILNESGFHEAEVMINSSDSNYSVLVTIGLTGRVHGYLMLQSDKISALNFVDQLSDYVGMSNIEEDFGPFHKSTLCEVVNQISGRSTILLSEIGLDSNITPPSLILGDSVTSSISDFDAQRSFYINDNFGSFKIFVGINIS